MVRLGDVRTSPDVKPDKAQVLKIAEEAMEVYSAWEALQRYCVFDAFELRNLEEKLLDECADLIQATCNLIAAIDDIKDFTGFMEACEERNRERGRL